MRTGDVIRGYQILTPFSTAGGGQSKWTFARKGETDYFLKQFLSPTYPTPDSPGGVATKARKLKQCETFEAHQKRLRDAVKPFVAEGGNLIATKEFFREGAKYYKVTEKVDTATLTPAEVASLPLEQRVLILRTVAHSLRILHGLSIVHGDLKPANILIRRTPAGLFTSKLIDFDNSYFEGEPPETRDDLVGDMAYYPPELAAFIGNKPALLPSALTVKSDIFALGLVFCGYLTGNLPDFYADHFAYAWMAAGSGIVFSLKEPGLPPSIVSLVNQMLATDPIDRPSIDRVYQLLRTHIRGLAVPLGEPAVGDAVELKGSLLCARRTPGPSEKATEAPSKLKGSLMRKNRE